jgi:fructokinase
MLPYICSFGEVLWDLLPTGALPGGAPMNLATHLQNLGVPSVMVSRVGKDELGEKIKAFMESKNVSTQFIQHDTAHGTGIVKVTLSSKNEATYEIVHPIAWDFIAPSPEIQEKAKNAYAVAYGTLACRDEVSRATLFGLLADAPLKIYDVNFRAPFYSQTLVESLLQPADIVKMNDDELHIIASWYGISGKTDRQKMSFLKKKFHLQALIVTQGGDGAMLLNQKAFYKTHGYKVTVADTVGSGDAFLAGFLKNLMAGKPPKYALTYACALGAVVATHRGANPPITEADVFKMMND